MRKSISIKNSGLFVGMVCIVMVGAVPAAQSGTMGNGGQQRNMITVRRCEAMPHNQMMNDQACKSMLALHPELFGGNAKPQNSNSH